jgi:ABC-type multidrug transport system permease subunit
MGYKVPQYVLDELKEYKKKHPFKGFLLDLWGVFVCLLICAIIIGYFYWLFFIS